VIRKFRSITDAGEFLDHLEMNGICGAVIIGGDEWEVVWDLPCDEPAAPALRSALWFPDVEE
jgi:hypothetical protein